MSAPRVNAARPCCSFGGCARPAVRLVIATREQMIDGFRGAPSRLERVTVEARDLCGSAWQAEILRGSYRAAGCDVTIVTL